MLVPISIGFCRFINEYITRYWRWVNNWISTLKKQRNSLYFPLFYLALQHICFPKAWWLKKAKCTADLSMEGMDLQHWIVQWVKCGNYTIHLDMIWTCVHLGWKLLERDIDNGAKIVWPDQPPKVVPRVFQEIHPWSCLTFFRIWPQLERKILISLHL